MSREVERSAFGELSESIISSLSVGIVAFDPDLEVIEANAPARDYIDVHQTIGESLNSGTDTNIWSDWEGQVRYVLTTGKRAEFESVKYVRNGTVRLLNLLCTPLVSNNSKESIGGALVIEDVTEKVEIANQLAQAERFAAVGKIAGKVAHELNNPMDGILRYLGLAIKSIDRGDREKPKEYLENCRSGLMRMVQIISKLLEFSRNTYSYNEQTTIENIVEDSVRSMEVIAPKVAIKIDRHNPSQSRKVRGSNMFQVFCNLIKNAIDAMESIGELAISIKYTKDIVEIQFCDTGCGFEPDKANAIFEPFFTTKPVGRGTGLGLAICRDLVEKYKGRITACNNAGAGSTFTVTLPIAELGGDDTENVNE